MDIVFRKDQKEIMKYKSGSMGIQAVPGAGKTFIITNLVAKLLQKMKSDDQDGKILVLTYMNSAANNFKSRIRAILEDEGLDKGGFEVMTIHSLAMKIIRENTDIAMLSEESQIIDDYKKGILIQMAIDEYESIPANETRIRSFLKKDLRDDQAQVDKWYREFTNIVLNAIKLMKYADISVDRLEAYLDLGQATIMKIIGPIYKNYQTILDQEGYFDYDDILIRAYRILVENESVAEKYQARYAYVFEDECQDSNEIQGKIIDIISYKKASRKKSKRNLVRVGDVNQSITGTFTGSDPRYFKDFCLQADYFYEMNMAARSSRDILDLANHLVDQARGHLEGIHIEPVESGQAYKSNPKTDKYMVAARSLKNQEEERDLVAKTIGYYQKAFLNYSIGVLSFSNYDTDDLGDHLDARDIKYDKLGADSKVRKKVIGDLKLTLDFLLEPIRDNFVDLVMEAFVARFDLDLSQEDLESIATSLAKEDHEALIYDGLYMDEWISRARVRLDDSIRMVFSKRMSESMLAIRSICDHNQADKLGLVSHILTRLNLTNNEVLLSKYIVFYLGNLLSYEGADLARLALSLDKRYSRVFDGAIESIYDMGETDPLGGSVTLATIHKSKGMEWDAVIITGINKSDFPSSLDDYFRVDRKYLRPDFKYPEAFVNMDIDKILGVNGDKTRASYEDDLKLALIGERVRLLYVGITRAKSSLLLLNSKNKFIESLNRNMFRKDSSYLEILTGYIGKRKKLWNGVEK
ncbi:ATP-dependent helicase [Peptostreptococcus stomatis]|uniref:ATP-dependent helicase n=1 Tax=Peptostreptococcus stomatis TaxID=341694 RepID=UPI0028EF1EF4|nr:ATP-dependent helicase [Peptostreptococcus stomatis]